MIESIYRYESEIFEIQVGNSDKPLKWRVGSNSRVPEVGNVVVSRIYLDSDGMILNGFSRIIVVAHPIDEPEFEYNFRIYPADFCSITTNSKAELDRLGYFDVK